MKKIIHKTNKYLLEKFPILWNTKLVWVLFISTILHLLFYILGYNTLTNPEILHEYEAKSIFFKNGTVFVNIIISVLLIVIWLILLFKNNAFKSFYPTSKFNLFKQFICYLIAIFCLTTFFISYNTGLKTYIESNYNDERITKEIEITNDAALFFSHDIKNYTINNRRYPELLSKLYCETYLLRDNKDSIKSKSDSLKNNLTFSDYEYTFYTLKEEKRKISQGFNTGYLFHKTKDSIITYFYKDSIYDVSNIINSAYPSYYNYSKTFFTPREALNNSYSTHVNYDLHDEYSYNINNYFTKKHENRSKRNQELLNRNNPEEIKKLLQKFISIINNYKINNNINSEKWFDLVYHPLEGFKLKNLIRTEDKKDYQFNLYQNEDAGSFSSFYDNYLTDFYIESDALYNTYENIESIKIDKTIIESIHFYIWLSFFLSSLIFMFRITGLKSLLFTILSVGILCLIVTLLTVMFSYFSGFNDNKSGYFISYLTLLIGSIILAIPIFFSRNIKKTIVSVCLNISIVGFILFIFLIITTITLHQTDFCRDYMTNYSYNECPTFLNSLGIYWSYILFIVNLIFIYFYVGIIKTWKALPEE